MLLLGVILAGLVLLLRPLPGIFTAMSSGVIIGKGHGSPRIERATEPVRFRNLLRQRLATAAPGAFLLLGVLGWMALNLLAAMAQAPR